VNTWRFVLCIGLVVAAVGCEPDLPRASNIDHMRVLGATIQVKGDPERTTPKPGETANMNWSVVFPDIDHDPSDLASLFFSCTMPTTFSGVPVCQEFLDAAESGNLSGVLSSIQPGQKLPDCAASPDGSFQVGPFAIACVTNTPQFDLRIPTDTKAAARLTRGVICRNGTPQFDTQDPSGLRCVPHHGVAASDIESLQVYGTVPVQYQDSDSNQNPSIDAASFLLHDPARPWQALSADESAKLNDDNCRDEGAAQRVLHSDGFPEQIIIAYDASAREIHLGEPESLEFSAYTTFGKLDRRFTLFDSDATPPLKNPIEWELSEDQRTALNGKSKRVRFYFTVLDQRGGFAVATRDLCVDR
jgi:hypothetical protein